MCGRYSLTLAIEDIIDICNALADELETEEASPRYNVPPVSMMPVILRDKQGGKRIKRMRWGLIPYWAKEKSIGSRLINARRETLIEKPAFKGLLSRRRCLIPADGYYEWQKSAAGKKPYRIITSDRKLFAFAGLWDEWRSPQGIITSSFTIITTVPISAITHIHDRMPLILSREQEDLWLSGPGEKQDMTAFLSQIAPETKLHAYPVSSMVNSPKNDLPGCIIQV